MKRRIWSTTCIYMRKEDGIICIIRDVFIGYRYWHTMVSTSVFPKWTRLPLKLTKPLNHDYSEKDSPWELIGDL
jgi:hypothetical protein